MEQINKIELTDEKIYPDESVLAQVLGDSFSSYAELRQIIGRLGLTLEWRYYHDGKAWLGKVQQKKKTILWMSAWKGFMKATVYFPDRYTEEICRLEIREETRQRFMNAGRVGKSLPCMFEIRDDDLLEDLETVMKFKISLKP